MNPKGDSNSASVGREDKVRAIVHAAVDEVNAQQPDATVVGKTPETVLFGLRGCLDSLGLVNLIVAVESAVGEHLGVSVTLADEKAMSQKHSPFRTVGSLIEYVSQRVAEAGGG